MSVQGPNAMDFSGFAELRARAGENDPKILREVARQFESLFTSMMLKNMRAASFGDPLTGGKEHESYRDMFDQQIAVEMSRGKGLGIADMLVRQLSGTVASAMQKDPAIRASGKDVTELPGVKNKPEAKPVSPDDFVQKLWPHARDAGAQLGVDPRAIVAQAALETGWGKHSPADGQGRESHNLFGIKAGSGWRGPAVKADTMEFEGGALRQRRASFRAYANAADSVTDYVKFMQSSPRYRAALAAGQDATAYARELQEAGYATDPDYADKLLGVMQSAPIRSIDDSLKNSAERPISPADTVLSYRQSGLPGPTRT